MSDKGSASSGGIGLSGAIFIVFLVLKLTEVIDWSWLWVTAPLWIPICIVAGLFCFFLVVKFILGIFVGKIQWRNF